MGNFRGTVVVLWQLHQFTFIGWTREEGVCRLQRRASHEWIIHKAPLSRSLFKLLFLLLPPRNTHLVHYFHISVVAIERLQQSERPGRQHLQPVTCVECQRQKKTFVGIWDLRRLADEEDALEIISNVYGKYSGKYQSKCLLDYRPF